MVLQALLADSSELKEFDEALLEMEKAPSARESREVSVALSNVDEEEAADDDDHKKISHTLQCDDIDIACSSPEDDVDMEDFGVCVVAVSPGKLDAACFVHGEEVSIAELGRMDASLEDYDIKGSKVDVQNEDSYSSAATSPAWEKPDTPEDDHDHHDLDECKHVRAA
jgi:hypothetical protein